MKLTKEKLKHMIKEEIARLDEVGEHRDHWEPFPMYAGEGPEDQAGAADLAGGQDEWTEDIYNLIRNKLFNVPAGLNSEGETILRALNEISRKIREQMGHVEKYGKELRR